MISAMLATKMLMEKNAAMSLMMSVISKLLFLICFYTVPFLF